MTIRLLNINEVGEVMRLNERFHFSNLDAVQRGNGFLRILYTQNDFEKILMNKEILVAIYDTAVVGYYLVGRTSNNPALDDQRKSAIALSRANAMAFDKVGYGCQVCIDLHYRKNGLYGQLLYELVNLVEDKYASLLCTISEENPISLRTHLANGWKIINEVERKKYLVYDITNVN
jgi:hypothetical protein